MTTTKPSSAAYDSICRILLLEAERNTQHGAGVLYNTVPSFVRLIACLHASFRQAVTVMGRGQSNICNSQQDVYNHDFSTARSDRRMLRNICCRQSVSCDMSTKDTIHEYVLGDLPNQATERERTPQLKPSTALESAPVGRRREDSLRLSRPMCILSVIHRCRHKKKKSAANTFEPRTATSLTFRTPWSRSSVPQFTPQR